MHRGFTFLETLIVIAVIGVVAVIVIPFLSGVVSSKDLDASEQIASDSLREAQSGAMSGKDPGKFGVHFEESGIVLFAGATYNALDANNVVHELGSRVSVLSVAFTPGGSCTVSGGIGSCDVHFANHRGTPAESGTIVLTDDSGATKSITINAVGMIDVQ